MRIAYVCKYCHHQVGELNRPQWDLHDVQRFCGMSGLSSVEQNESIAYNQSQSTAYVQVVCDYCQEAVEDNPELLLEGKLLQ